MMMELLDIRKGIEEIGWVLESWTPDKGEIVVLRFMKVIEDTTLKPELIIDEETLKGRKFIIKLKKFLTNCEKNTED